jgi:chromosomal replication initiator protein
MTEKKAPAIPPASLPINITLNPKYTFDTFIVGGSNRLAAATAQAVAAKPGVAYNPLFLYGGVGLGKTHLAQAIGHAILEKSPKKKIIYVSCENFTNEFIQSISAGKVNDFKNKYREADVLLVDDIQFLSGKDGTQEEFFHTFNALHQSNRQIVITSDRVPKAIPQLEARLSSRFGCGMVADIQPPNVEMRIAILQAKCEEKNYVIASEVINFIAENIESNIRELEGAVIRIISYCELNKVEPTIEITTKVLEDMISVKSKNITIEKIIKIVCDYFNLMPEHLLGQKRSKELVGPRQITMYLLRHELNMSFPKIGKELNKKDHTTIMYGVEKIEKEITKNIDLQKDIAAIKEKLYLN